MILISNVLKLFPEILQNQINFFPRIKSNQVLIISCYQEEHKHLTCKIIRIVFYIEKNQSLKMQNKGYSYVKEGMFTQIS